MRCVGERLERLNLLPFVFMLEDTKHSITKRKLILTKDISENNAHRQQNVINRL